MVPKSVVGSPAQPRWHALELAGSQTMLCAGVCVLTPSRKPAETEFQKCVNLHRGGLKAVVEC